MEYSDGDSFYKPPYTMVDENRIRQLQDKDISEVCTLLSVSRSFACPLLRRNNWSKNSVFDEWFADEKQVRWSLGLLQKRKPLKLFNQCKICLKSFKVESMLSGPCGHPFCTNCWKSYIAASIDSGPGCLGLRCPEPKCKPYPGLELIDSLASDYNKGKYYKYLLGSYVEGCWNLKWCPGPGCNLCWKVRRGREFDEYEEKLKRYMHYYERWVAIHKSREITAGNLKWAKDELICVVAENNQQLPGDGVELVIEAFELIMESRTALKWSYAYGYYMPWRANSAKLAFFLFLKGQAERVLETLHRCAERGVEKYSKTDFHLYEFRDFTDELRGLTDLTRNHFGELVRALENNLSEVTEVKKPVKKPPAPSKRRTR